MCIRDSHKDDIIETMLLSLIFEGRFHSFSPKTYLDRMDLTVIRPMMFVDEMDVIGFKNKYDLPVVKSKCPVDGHTKMCIRDRYLMIKSFYDYLAV